MRSRGTGVARPGPRLRCRHRRRPACARRAARPEPRTPMTVTVDLPVPRRALAVGAHPDDIEFGCGATLAKWADAGAHVTMCVCTDGAKGTWDRDADLAALVAQRETEQRDAGAALGADDVEMLRFVDGELVDNMTARAAVCRVIRRTRPDV